LKSSLNFSELFVIFPEIFLSSWILFYIIFGVFSGGSKLSKQKIFTLTASLGLLITFILVYIGDWKANRLLSDLFVQDRLSVYMKLLVLFSGIVIIYISEKYRSFEKLFIYEYPLLILFSILGMLIMISANDFISLYMGLELQSLSLYVLASMKKDSSKSSEAGLKYFILGALASGFFLFGVSLLFGIAGTTTYTELSLILVNYENYSPLLALAIVMILCSIAFKLSAAPFHMWTPDVYEGSPTTVTAFIAVVPKIAAVAIIVRVLYIPFGNIYEIWYQILIMISVASIYVGAFGALVQDNIKRLMAYSTIGSIGYVLLALSAGSQEALQGALIYITIYTISVMGSFVAIVFMEKDNIALEKISDLAGISKTDPYTAICFSILLLSLAGLPPFAGFVGKFYIFRSLIIEDLTWLAVIGVIGSVIAAYYYLKLIKIMYLDSAEEPLIFRYNLGSKIILGVTSLMVVSFLFYAKSVVNFIEYISFSISL
tara:strand:+ start:2086 stop:3546 length:1461 start_codon:yes stop_codon:yes gene_type:complete